MRVLVVLLHARFSVVSPIPFLLAAIFFGSSLYVTRCGILDHMQIIFNFQDGASNPATPCFFDFFFFSFYESTIFPLPTDEVSAMCDAF